MRLIPWACVAASLAGCGYSVGGLIEHESVFVEFFGNDDERRTHEFELTRAVNRELQARGVRVNDAAAPVLLKGKILEITEPSVVEGQSDETIVGSVSFRIEVALVSRSTGRQISKRVVDESATFSTIRLQNRDTARRKVIDSLARRVATFLEKDF